MPEMTSRDRLLKALKHQEGDRVPIDLGSTQVTTISHLAYRNLRRYLGMSEEKPRWLDVAQQVVVPGEDLLERFGVDTRGVVPLTSANWNVYERLEDGGENWVYRDEWGLTQHFPKEAGHWFTVVGHPLENADPVPESVDAHQWPHAGDPARVEGLREWALACRAAGKAVVLKGLCAGIFEMAQRLRGMENALMDPAMFPEMSDRLYGRIADLKIAFWQMALAELGDVVDVVMEGDDYGTQVSQLISPAQFRSTLKPHLARVVAAMHRGAPEAAVFFHSCGNVRPILPDFIEIGIDILNPVHISAAGMEPAALKRDFGRDITFWGGGVETQSVLPTGTPDQVREDVKRNLDALAPGGGYVFCTVHNIMGEVPPANLETMYETALDYGRYNV